MYNFANQPNAGPDHPPGPTCHPGSGRPSLLRMVVAAVLIGIVASLIFGSAVWAVGLVFHLVGVLIKLAILVTVGSFIWRRVVRRHSDRGRI